MSRMKGSSFFCEDLRTEQSGQPIIVGVLSPIVEFANEEDSIPKLNFVSFFYPTEDHSGLNLELTISISQAGSEEKVVRGPLVRSIDDETMEDSGEALVIASLPIDDVKFRAGTTIEASLQIGEELELYKVRGRLVPDERT